MFTCYIIDDEISISTLSGFISLLDHLTLIGSHSNPKGLANKLSVIKPDIVFIDYYIAQNSPSETIQLGTISTVIVTGNSPTLAYDALQLNAIDFLIKPLEYSAFLRAIIKSKKIRFRELERGLKTLIETNDHFFIKKDSNGKKIVKVKYEDIIYIEGSQNYVSLIMEKENHLAYLTMKEIEENLPADKFIRVHRSYIINIDKINTVDGNQIFFDDNQKILIGSSYRNHFQQRLNEKLLKSKRTHKGTPIQYFPASKENHD